MRYYFDTLDGKETMADKSGLDFLDDDAAIAEAMQSLGDWASDSSREANSCGMSVVVRDETHEVARLTVRLDIELPPPLMGTA